MIGNLRCLEKFVEKEIKQMCFIELKSSLGCHRYWHRFNLLTLAPVQRGVCESACVGVCGACVGVCVVCVCEVCGRVGCVWWVSVFKIQE